MASPFSPSVSTLREAVRQAVERDSLRSVAAQIGMSPMGLSHFLDGGLNLAFSGRPGHVLSLATVHRM